MKKPQVFLRLPFIFASVTIIPYIPELKCFFSALLCFLCALLCCVRFRLNTVCSFNLLSGKDRLAIVCYSTDSSGFHRFIEYCPYHAFPVGLLRDERPVAVNAFSVLIPGFESTHYSCCRIYVPGEVDRYGYFRAFDPINSQILSVEDDRDAPGKHFAGHRYRKLHRYFLCPPIQSHQFCQSPSVCSLPDG